MKKKIIVMFLAILMLGIPSSSASYKIGSILAKDLQNSSKDEFRVIVILELPKSNHNFRFHNLSFLKTQISKIQSEVLSSLNKSEFRLKKKYSTINAFAGVATREGIRALERNPHVKAIQKDKEVRIFLQDSVPLINATSVWNLQINGINLTGSGETVCVIDTGVDYTHNDLGNCTLSDNTVNGSVFNYILESAHPYANNFSYVWNITNENFTKIGIHFERISTEPQWDYIEIYDENYTLLANYTGEYRDIWTPSANGTTIRVALRTDASVTFYGFKIDKIVNGTAVTNFTWKNCNKVIGGYDFVNLDPDPMDEYCYECLSYSSGGHGTHCAGIVAANGLIKGVAPDTKIIAIKALNYLGSGYESDILAGIDWCVNNASKYNISVISMSLGSNDLYSSYCDSQWPAFSSAINIAVANGISVVVASGNNANTSGISAPACIENATPIGATDKSDVMASFTNRGFGFPEMLLAPGVSINSTIPDGYDVLSGTSMATPHVAGAIALLKQFARLSGKSLTPQKIEQILNETGKRIYDSETGLYFSRIDILAAVKSQNDDPVVFSMEIVPKNPSTNDDLGCNVTIVDNESTSLIVYYTWYKNGTQYLSGSISVINNTPTIVSVLGYGNTSEGDNWTCEVIPYDGIENGTKMNSTITINNSAPTLINFTMTPSVGNSSTLFNFTVIYRDVDNDAPQYINITINGISYEMREANASDTNFVDGKLYYFNKTFENGIHELNISILASDGIETAEIQSSARIWVADEIWGSPQECFINSTTVVTNEYIISNCSIEITGVLRLNNVTLNFYQPSEDEFNLTVNDGANFEANSLEVLTNNDTGFYFFGNTKLNNTEIDISDLYLVFAGNSSNKIINSTLSPGLFTYFEDNSSTIIIDSILVEPIFRVNVDGENVTIRNFKSREFFSEEQAIVSSYNFRLNVSNSKFIDVIIEVNGNSRVVINNSNLSDLYLERNSEVIIQNSVMNGWVDFFENSTSVILNSTIYKAWLNGNANVTFKSASTISDLMIGCYNVNTNAILQGYVGIGRISYWWDDSKLNRFYPIRVEGPTGIGAGNVTVNITLDGEVINSGQTDENGWISLNITFNRTSGYDPGYSYYIRVGNIALGPINSSTDTRYGLRVVDNTPPEIFYKINPKVVINGSNVSLFATSVDNVKEGVEWANITFPDNSSVIIYLPANFTVNETGIFNVTFFANDSAGNLANLSDYFISALPLIFNLSIKKAANETFFWNLTVLYEGNAILTTLTNQSNVSLLLPAYIFDLKFLAFNDSLTVMFRNINLSAENNRSVGLDKLQLSGFLVTYVIDPEFNYSSASLALSYRGTNYKNKNYLGLYKCSLWNFSARRCEGSWQKVSDAVNNQGYERFLLNVSSFSAFAIKQEAYCGDGSCNNGETCRSCPQDCGPCPSGGGGGGGGKGGGSRGGGYVAQPSASCYDGIQNCHHGSCEEGIDCGGPCEPCPSCHDGIQNQGETGVDCGGPCPPCPITTTTTLVTTTTTTSSTTSSTSSVTTTLPKETVTSTTMLERREELRWFLPLILTLIAMIIVVTVILLLIRGRSSSKEISDDLKRLEEEVEK